MRAKYPPHLQAAIDLALEGQAGPRAERVELVLPFPPSVNNLYRTIKLPNGQLARAKSKRARQYDTTVRHALAEWQRTSGLRPPRGPYSLIVRLYPPRDGRRHDLSNSFKAPEDAIFAAIGEDDNDVHTIVATKLEPVPKGRVEIILEGRA